jgi:hypothetical protein
MLLGLVVPATPVYLPSLLRIEDKMKVCYRFTKLVGLMTNTVILTHGALIVLSAALPGTKT